MADLPSSGCEVVAKELGPCAVYAPVDVTSEVDVAAALDLAEREFGSNVNLAVNCAGVLIASKLLGKKGPHDLQHFLKLMTINVGGTFNVCRLAAARMATNPTAEGAERGVIINTASVAAFDGQMGQCAYAASKGAVASMTLPMARDLSGFGIRVVTVAPGIFLTPMMSSTVPQAARDALAKMVPFPKRLGDPDEFAQFVQFAVENQYLNGEVVRLDGSLRMV